MVYHLHNSSSVMVSILNAGTEFRITHQKLIQGIQKGNSGKFGIISLYTPVDTKLYQLLWSTFQCISLHQVTLTFKCHTSKNSKTGSRNVHWFVSIWQALVPFYTRGHKSIQTLMSFISF